ncbi:MAG: SHOCT domain-containing protein [Clostridia bacterium]
MTNTDNEKKYALIAAICYTITAVYNIINNILYVSNYEYASITVLNILSWSILIGFATTLYIKNAKAIIFVTSAYTLLNIYYLISNFSLWDLFIFIAIGALVLIIIFALNGNDIVKKMWFIPSLVMMVGNIIGWISYEYFDYISYVWKSMLIGVVEVVALIFVGLWLRGNGFPSVEEPTNEYAVFNPNVVPVSSASNNTIGGADKLKMYKELLDSGTITQEEFDAKKKQILDL